MFWLLTSRALSRQVFQPMLIEYFTYDELKELKAKVIQQHREKVEEEVADEKCMPECDCEWTLLGIVLRANQQRLAFPYWPPVSAQFLVDAWKEGKLGLAVL